MDNIVWASAIGRKTLMLINLVFNSFRTKESRIDAWCDADSRHKCEKWLITHRTPTLEEFF